MRGAGVGGRASAAGRARRSAAGAVRASGTFWTRAELREPPAGSCQMPRCRRRAPGRCWRPERGAGGAGVPAVGVPHRVRWGCADHAARLPPGARSLFSGAPRDPQALCGCFSPPKGCFPGGAPMLGHFFRSSVAASSQTCLAFELLGLSASLSHRIAECLGWRAP